MRVPLQPLEPSVWRAAAEAHRTRVLDLVHGSVAIDKAHPVFNFLFGYYAFEPKQLLRYSPGADVELAGVAPEEPLLWTGRGWVRSGGIGVMDPCAAPAGVRAAARRAATILRATSDRAPHLNCYGLHEWAMLYTPPGAAPAHRHQKLPLRLSQAELNAVVEAHPVACTHFDAYRFFTPSAAPLNTATPTPTRQTQPALEQPGCVHATMDLFRYALKLWPWIPSELLADSLEIAISARVLDMRASPYDLSEWAGERGGFDLAPVAIENEGGRREYQREQSRLAQRAAPLRARVLGHYDAAIRRWESSDGALARRAARVRRRASAPAVSDGGVSSQGVAAQA